MMKNVIRNIPSDIGVVFRGRAAFASGATVCVGCVWLLKRRLFWQRYTNQLSTELFNLKIDFEIEKSLLSSATERNQKLTEELALLRAQYAAKEKEVTDFQDQKNSFDTTVAKLQQEVADRDSKINTKTTEVVALERELKQKEEDSMLAQAKTNQSMERLVWKIKLNQKRAEIAERQVAQLQHAVKKAGIAAAAAAPASGEA